MKAGLIRTWRFVAAVTAGLSLFALADARAGAIAQKPVNAIGPTPINWLLAGNPRMQQNEPEGVVSPNNPDWLALGFNDYRAVNVGAIGDAFPGIAMSRDGGRTWISALHPGHLLDTININKKFGADPNLEAVPYLMYYNFIAGWRDGSQPGGVYVSRWYEHNREVGPPWEHLDTIEINAGTAGRFLDKPAFDVALRNPDDGLPDVLIDIPAFDDPRNPANSHEAYTLAVPAHRMHLCYAVFVGNDNNDGTKIDCLASDDGGVTWPIKSKLSESVEINQGVSLATRNYGQEVLAVWTRFEDNNENAAIMYTLSTDFGNTWDPARVLTEFCGFNQSTGAARHRTNALPVATSNGTDFSVFFAARNDGTETCNVRGKGNKPDTPRMSPVALEDDFDSFGETPDADGNRVRDGMVRTSLNFSRILMTRAGPGNRLNWSAPTPVDAQAYAAGATNEDGSPIAAGSRKRGHQYMPAVETAGGIETISWYDSRLDRLNRLPTPIPGGFVEDLVLHLEPAADDPSRAVSATLLPAGLYDLVPPPAELPPATSNVPLQRTLDVFAAQYAAHRGGFQPYSVDQEFYPVASAGTASTSTRVSRFATRQKPGAPPGVRQQVEFDYPNARLFRKGKAPFIGDYKTVYSLQARQRADGEWVPNQGPPAASDWFPAIDPVFHVGWTSNKDVRGPVFYTGCDEWDETLQMWVARPGCASPYTDPNPGALMPLQGEDGSADGPPLSCTEAQASSLRVGPLTRNQNIYTAAMKPNVNVEVYSAIKLPDGVGFNTFVLSVQNGSQQPRRVRLSVTPGQLIDFDKDPAVDLYSIEVFLPRGTTNARTLFDIADTVTAPVIVEAYDVTALPPGSAEPGELVARVPLLRDSLVPLENVQNNDPDPDARIDLTGPAGAEFYSLILKREIGSLQTLDLENLDLENTVDLLDLENLDLENLDLENRVLFLDLENLDLENLDLENALYASLDLENVVLNLDLENLDLENRLLYLDLENLDLENLDLENLDLENLDLENLDLENLDLENLDLENFTVFASDIENLDLENLDLENVTPGDEYLEVSWTADSATNTTTGVDVKPIFSPQIQADLAASGATVVLTVREGYLTGTVAVNPTAAEFCAPRIVAQNQVLYSVVLRPDQINELIADPDPTNADTPSFIVAPDASKIISLRVFRPPSGLTVEDFSANTGMAIYSQPGTEPLCDAEIGGNEVFNVCEVDYTEPVDEPPVITLLGADPLTVEAAPGAYVDPGVSVQDDVDDGLVATIASNTVDLATPGTYAIVWTVTDSGDNTSTVTRTVIVVDTTPPAITAPADLAVEATAPATPVDLGAAVATDFVGPVTVTNDAPAGFPLGATTVTWTATDGAGNSAQDTQTVTVGDTTPPVITLLGDNPLTLEASSDPYVDPGATATDSVNGDVSGSIVVSHDVDPSVVGSYAATLTASDAAGNEASRIRTVVVVDTVAPQILIGNPPPFTPPAPFLLDPGDTTLTISWPVGARDLQAGLAVTCAVGTPPVLLEPVATSYDAASGTLSAEFSNDFPAGTTTVTCTVVDQGGNSVTSAPFSVEVEDIPVIEALAPVVTVTTDADGGNAATVANATLAANVTATDLVDGDLGDAVACLDDDPTVFPVGDANVTCRVTDSAGNTAAASFTLTVVYRYGFEFLLPKGNIRAGSSLPLDWFYTDRLSGLPVDSSGFTVGAFWVGPYADRNCTVEGPDFGLGDGQDAGSSDFRYSMSLHRWQFSWQTPSLPGSYLFTVEPPGTDLSTVCVYLR